MVNTIEWRRGEYSTYHGYVGPLHAFSYSWKSRREDPNWVMQCTLPGLESRRWADDDPEVLQKQAAEVLATWLRQVFGIRPPEDEEAAFRAWYDSADIGHDLKWLAEDAFEAGWLAHGESWTS
jgi:hypothetical protein